MNQEQKALPSEVTDPERRAFLAWTSIWSVGALALPLAGCGSSIAQEVQNVAYTMDTSIQSPSQDSRVRTLVLHYTAETLADSIALLTDPQKEVSSHYLVPDAADGGERFRVYALVPEAGRAWHAGVSYWQGERMLNASTVGIEVVNLGFPAQDKNAPLINRRWYPYPDAQIAVVGRLAADVVARHGIRPQKVVGHSDIAPGRKLDPGPLFPWKKLYEQYGVGAWPEAEAVGYYRNHQPFRGDIAELQAKLLAYGYDAPQTGMLDAQTVNVVAAFQMHFRSAKYDGTPDVETVAILDALLEKYFRRGRAQRPQAVPGQLGPQGESEKGSDAWSPSGAIGQPGSPRF
ncbi:N-acetylmuramoyl-L-alanine amidase (plasmid) [Ralstonia solanacearum]|uniref:N-acetylmuramoyl-L-alanine amidase n=1 Tax=Ralstonia solanacearum TaxID=305 RepID=UPI0005AC5AA3|nr:N-acetylmuramoyl-L-alanine amidase [Ralstonia solanacearum]MDB0509847.1 N-acetylmuramoyl-L-alanine amidase [Ralstonia solanacearum]MDB0511918.1 N-acetylmuramoyl-L-alanine amidase [Ralstonia solanacearum]MDB0527221.1 N-acetylmuramoyl-L-alanine amidase [Ralstonia solanacearum]QTY25520.1 N-acetylmuramoyl-L-alanine amidase [Ralstonia solanacearum]